MAGLTDNTPGGTLAYCDYLLAKGYATAAQVNPWRTAIQKVFETVEGEGWEALDLTTVDLDEYLSRFRTLAGAQYKAESISAYKRRIHNALDAHEHYRSTGRPPSFRQNAKRAKADPADSSPAVVSQIAPKQTPAPKQQTPNGLHSFTYPLGGGHTAKLELPPRMSSDDVNRLCAFIRTLQDDKPEQRQLPRQAGGEQEAA